MTSVPRAVAFDLDGCLWDPEMYELWSSGGSPFRKEGDCLVDRGGVAVRLMGDARHVLKQLCTEDKFQNNDEETKGRGGGHSPYRRTSIDTRVC